MLPPPAETVVANLTAKALRNAHRFESLLRSNDDRQDTRRRSELDAVLKGSVPVANPVRSLDCAKIVKAS